MQSFISGDINLQVQQKFFQTLCSEAPNLFVLILPPRAKYRLREVFNVSNDNDVIPKIKAIGDKWEITKDNHLRLPLSTEFDIYIHNDSVTFGNIPYKLFFDPSKLSQAGNVVQIARKLTKDTGIKVEWIKQLFTADFAGLWQDGKLQAPIINENRKQDIYDVFKARLFAQGYKSKDSLIREEAYKLTVGTIVMENFQKNKFNQKTLYQEIPAMNIENLYINETESADLQRDRAMRDIASRAVDMAFPGVGTALTSVMDILEGIFDNSDIIDQLRGIYKKKIELRTEMLNRLEQLQSTRSNSQIASYEYEIAKINMELSGYKQEEYSKMLKNVADDRRFDVRRKIDMQLPLYYYYAERLRYYYQRLNKASSFWFGPENTLKELLYADNSNMRLALDESIRLFDWIKAADVSSSRQDIDSLFNFWKRHEVLVKNYKNELQRGTRSAGSTEIRKMVIELSRAYPESWKKFSYWKADAATLSNPSETFEVDLTEPLSYYNRWGFDENFTSLKTIGVSFVALDKMGNKLDIPVEIRHPGISLLEGSDLQVLKEIEPLTTTEEELKVAGGIADLEQPNLIRTLANRWYATSNYIPGHFEGYNIRTKWQVKFKPNPAVPQMQKFYLVFTIQSNRRSNMIKDDLPRYTYLVNMKRTTMSRQESYSVICTEAEAKRYDQAISNAMSNKNILHGSINILHNGNTTEIYPKIQ